MSRMISEDQFYIKFGRDFEMWWLRLHIFSVCKLGLYFINLINHGSTKRLGIFYICKPRLYFIHLINHGYIKKGDLISVLSYQIPLSLWYPWMTSVHTACCRRWQPLPHCHRSLSSWRCDVLYDGYRHISCRMTMCFFRVSKRKNIFISYKKNKILMAYR